MQERQEKSCGMLYRKKLRDTCGEEWQRNRSKKMFEGTDIRIWMSRWNGSVPEDRERVKEAYRKIAGRLRKRTGR